MTARCWLYVPGDRPDRFAKAAASGADAVIVDLEDAVALDDKDDARRHVVDALGEEGLGPVRTWVRVNTGERGAEDLRSLRGCPGLHGVVVPKATPEVLDGLAPLVEGLEVCALVESARAVLELPALASHPLVTRLALGEVDLTADLDLAPGADDALWPIRLRAVVAAAASGLDSPVGPVWVDVGDADGLRRSTEALRDHGVRARQAVHPAQVAVINEVLTPTPDEVEAAEALLAQAAAAGGGVHLDERGRMVDEAVLRSARRLLERAAPTRRAETEGAS